MIKKTGFIVKIIILYYILTAFNYSHASVQHGPVFGLSYFPFGYGRMSLPYADGVAGTAGTIPEEGSSSRSAGKYSASIGYFYDIFHADFLYEVAKIQKQVFSNTRLGQDILKGEKKNYLLRGGKRFSNPGDSTYHLIYFGLKRMDFASDYENIEVTALGYLIGYEGFYSFGIINPVEFVVKVNTFLGTYRKEKFSSDIQFENVRKKNSITAGADLGIGFQYEPYDIAMLFKFSYDIDQIAYRAALSGSGLDFACRIQGSYFGFEIIYRMPNFKYNTVK